VTAAVRDRIGDLFGFSPLETSPAELPLWTLSDAGTGSKA
jgi:hypothetical protein